MQENLLHSIMDEFCASLGIEISEEKLCIFDKMLNDLKEFNSKINVTALREDKSIIIRHFCDSVSGLGFDLIPQNASVIDVGCGAGFPGLPIKIMRDDISLCLVDSTEKKLGFSKAFSAENGFTLKAVAGRAEELAKGEMRESFDVAVSRAVASLPVLLELCLPFVKQNGTLICYKSLAESDLTNPESELSKSSKAISMLGGKLEDIKKVALPKENQNDAPQVHALLVIKKIKKCSTIYPRRYAQILKKPL